MKENLKAFISLAFVTSLAGCGSDNATNASQTYRDGGSCSQAGEVTVFDSYQDNRELTFICSEEEMKWRPLIGDAKNGLRCSNEQDSGNKGSDGEYTFYCMGGSWQRFYCDAEGASTTAGEYKYYCINGMVQRGEKIPYTASCFDFITMTSVPVGSIKNEYNHSVPVDSIKNEYIQTLICSATGQWMPYAGGQIASSSSGQNVSYGGILIVSSSSTQSVSSESAITEGSKYDATAQTLTDLRDDKIYKTVTIGTQTWMAENLNYEYNKGSAKSFCFNNSADSCAKYGRLYLWSAAMDSAAVFSTAGKGCGYGKACGSSGTIRGVCPENWHLPSSDEWNTLISAGGGVYSAGASLKSGYGWKSGGNGVDTFGFAILPAGYRHASGAFQDVGVYGDFWSSSVGSGYSAYYLNFDYNYEGVTRDNFYVKDFGYSVRCLKDTN